MSPVRAGACDETDRVPIRTEPCYGWIDSGHPWHGCMMQPGHGTEGGRGRHRTHECRCGHTWETRHHA